MADRYQDRAYAAGNGRGADQYGSDRGESDPLAELARLIGQSDPLGQGRAGGQSQRPAATPEEVDQDYYRGDDYEPEPEPPPAPPAGPPSWIQRANVRREPPREASRETPRAVARDFPRELPRALPPEPDDHPGALHPLHRYAPQPQVPQPQVSQPQVAPPEADGYYDEQAYQKQAYQQQAYQQQGYQQQAYQHDRRAYAESEPEVDPARYDDALYGQIENGVQDFQRDPAYPDDPYAYQGEYDEESEEPQRRRGLPLTVAAVLALGVFGVAAAYGYHTYFGTTRPGEIPIITADNSPTKIVPAQSDTATKMPDRMATGDGTEKIVPREEQPVDINSRNVGPRVVFPPLNQNANPPSVASVTPTAMPPAPTPGVAPGGNSGTLPNGEPRKIKTFSVKGDEPDPSAVPLATPPAAPTAAPAKNAKAGHTNPATANASANAPLSLSPQAQSAAPMDSGTQVASTNPSQVLPSAPAEGAGGYMVQILWQRSEAEALASFRAMQSKYPSVLGSQTPVIRRHEAGEKGVIYRAMVGPFGNSQEAGQFCGSYKNAGGQCFVLKN